MSGSFRVCILLEEQSRYFKPERRLKFRVSRRLPEQISFSSDGIDAGLRVRRLQLLQSSSFSLEKREKSKSSRTTEEMFNFSTEELLGRLIELLLPQLLKEMSRSFSFLHEERSRLSRLLCEQFRDFRTVLADTSRNSQRNRSQSATFQDFII